MSDAPRRPGRVVEQASTVDGPRFPAPQTEGEADQIDQRNEAGRLPVDLETRRVHAPATPMEDETSLAAPAEASVLNASEEARSSIWQSIFWLLIASAGFWGIGSATLTLVDLWQQQLLLAVPLTGVGLILLGLLGRALRIEWQAVRAVDALAQRRTAVELARVRNDLDSLKTALASALDNLHARHPALMDEFNAAAASRTDCADYLELFDNLVLRRLDKEAQMIINRSAIVTGTAVAAVPHPAFDAVVVLWRAIVMTRELGTTYGLRPTGLSSWRLMRHTLGTAMLAASMETLGSLALDETGRGALERAGKNLAEGVVIASRIRRLGQLTQKACRPVDRVTKRDHSR